MNAQPQMTSLDPRVESFIGKPRRALIDGKWTAAKSGKSFDVFDPSSGAVIARVADCESVDVDAAVSAARRAFDHGPLAAHVALRARTNPVEDRRSDS
jgi:phenylacetaldehyde dehydrogenase